TTDAAIEAAGYVADHLRELSGIGDSALDLGATGSLSASGATRTGGQAASGTPPREAKLREFCRRFAERAFRRPLTPEQEQLYVDRQFQEAPDPETAVKRVVLLVLKSPRF